MGWKKKEPSKQPDPKHLGVAPHRDALWRKRWGVIDIEQGIAERGFKSRRAATTFALGEEEVRRWTAPRNTDAPKKKGW